MSAFRTAVPGPVPHRTGVRVVAALMTACLVAACGVDAATERAATTTSEAGTDGTAGSGGGTALPGSSAPTTAGSGAVTTTDTSAPSPTATGPDTTAAAPATPLVPTPGAVGAFGPWYLGDDGSASVVIEVRSQSGAEPTAATIDRIRGVLADVSGKRVSTTGGVVPGAGRQWTAADIRAEADRTGPSQSAESGVLTLLFLRGGLAGSDSTIGVAVRSDVAAVFSDRVDDAAGLLTSSARIETAVTTHEVGHLLGLVDLVLATGREDPEHPGHSRNTGSVMYYAVESTLVGDILGGGPPVDFDRADLDDLRAIAAQSS
ncbi:MAG: hypothetical protein OSA99_08460 [Acidimicrobiales bacterium]|nr:hypothetical protein [Acidimicrobiales bacterium]